MWSTVRRSVTARTGAARARRETPSSSQRSISRSRTSFGAVEKVTTTCSIAVLLDQPLEIPARAEHRQRQRRARPAAPCRGSRRARGRARGARADGVAVSRPMRPAPTISVGLASSPWRRALQLRPVERDAARGEVDRAEGEQPQRLRGEVVDVAGKQDPRARARPSRRARSPRDLRARRRAPRAEAATSTSRAAWRKNSDETAVDDEPDGRDPRRCRAAPRAELRARPRPPAARASSTSAPRAHEPSRAAP